VIRIRLTRKLAGCLNGLDVSAVHVGDVIDLPDQAARMLSAEGWAEKVIDNPLPLTRRAIPST
jgi:hypothetical protein